MFIKNKKKLHLFSFSVAMLPLRSLANNHSVHLRRTSSLHVSPRADFNGDRPRRPVRRTWSRYARTRLHHFCLNELLNFLRSYACLRIGQIDGLYHTLRSSFHRSFLVFDAASFLPILHRDEKLSTRNWKSNDKRSLNRPHPYALRRSTTINPLSALQVSRVALYVKIKIVN